MGKTIFSFLIIPVIFLFSQNLNAASFPCSKASSPMEKLICSDPEINDLDTKLGSLYYRLKKKLPSNKRKAFINQHRKWLKTRSDCNKSRPCLLDKYKKRVTIMVGELSEIENHDNFIGTYKSFDNSCGLYLRIYKEDGYYRFHLKTTKKNVKGFLFMDPSDNIYFTFSGLYCDDCNGKSAMVTGVYLNKMIVIQNYGNSMNNYTKFNECSPKYIQLSKQ